jgi:hypothetical protein
MSIKFGDKDYALVPDRLKKFREENPRASIETEHELQVDGSITFKATIVKDLADPASARATGTARYTEIELKKPKAFEKLETVSCGRALANLGYLNDGQIATTEEMEEWEAQQFGQAKKDLKKATTRKEFKAILAKAKTPEQKQELTPLVQARIKEVAKEAKSGTEKRTVVSGQVG